MAGYSVQPKFEIPLRYTLPLWKDPKTDLFIPKPLDANIRWRKQLLLDAEKDVGFQREMFAACSESFLFFVNAFVWTYHQKDIDPITHEEKPAEVADWPFITWPVQDLFANWLEDHFNRGKDGLVPKTRDMAGSWESLTFFHWLWLFRKIPTELREISRKEDLVDGNSDSLMWKHDYINKWLPEFLRPPGVLIKGKDNRTKLHLKNILNGNTIAGEGTTGLSLSGGRAAALLLDEFAKIQYGSELRSSTRDVAPCRIVVSSSWISGDEWRKWKIDGTADVFPHLWFWNHPEKGKGRYIIEDDSKRFHIHSPWFDIERKIRPPQHVAQELLGEDIESGTSVFSPTNVDKHIHLFGREPTVRYNIILKNSIPDNQIPGMIQRRNVNAIDVRQTNNGKLLVWGDLVLGRPSQQYTYMIGIDASKGQGASESVASIKCEQTGEKIARWSDANTPPYEFAKIIVAIAIWVGGSNPRNLPMLKWEMNGPGWDLGRLLVKKYGYPYYYSYERPGTVTTKQTNPLRYGWPASRTGKLELLGLYDKSLIDGTFINHDIKGLEQAKLYVHYPGGGCGPVHLVHESQSARLLHGDIVIADALTLDDKKIIKPKPSKGNPPRYSFAWRKQQFDKRKKKPKGWRKRFDFTRI